MDVLITFDVNNLQTVSVYDATTFTPPSYITDVKGVRLLFQTVNSAQDITSDVTTFLAWYEYEITSGTAIANGVSYVSGAKMIFANDTTPTGTFTAQTTGRYSQYISDNLPSSGNPWVFTPDQVGRTPVNTSYFQDEVYTMDYEFYTTLYAAGATLAAGTYLVVGTAGYSVLIGGAKTLYVGETYVSAGSETFSGSSNLILFSEESSYNFTTQYETFNIYEDYLAAKAVAVAPSWQLDSNLLTVAALYASPTIAAQTTSGISLQQLQDNLDRIINYYAAQLPSI